MIYGRSKKSDIGEKPDLFLEAILAQHSSNLNLYAKLTSSTSGPPRAFTRIQGTLSHDPVRSGHSHMRFYHDV